MFDPQQMLVEEKGLENQIKRLKDLIPNKQNRIALGYFTGMTGQYLAEQLTNIVESLEDIKTGIKNENDRIQESSLKRSIEHISNILK